MILRCMVVSCAPDPTDGPPPGAHNPAAAREQGRARPGSTTCGVVVAYTQAEAAASLGGQVRGYDLLRTVNDAGREVVGFLRRHQRCHQGRCRWTRAINCWTP